jgi:hypothetical protein
LSFRQREQLAVFDAGPVHLLHRADVVRWQSLFDYARRAFVEQDFQAALLKRVIVSLENSNT